MARAAQMALVAVAAVGLAALMMPTVAAESYPYFEPSADLGTYTNVSADIADIQTNSMAGNYAQAYSVYSAGKNAYRNITAGTFRIARGVATAGNGHAGEAYYEAFKAFYGTMTFLDAWLGGALNGTGEFAASDAFRANSAAMYASVYGWIYILHEADVGYLLMTGYTSPVRNITRNGLKAIEEIDDAYALYLGKGPTAPRAVALAAAKKACLSSSRVNAQMKGAFDGFTVAQAAAINFNKAGNTSEASAQYAKEYLAGRNQMVHYLTRSWVQITMDNLRSASRTSDPSAQAAFKAKALAAFRAAAPFINAQPGGACTVETGFRNINTISKMSFKKVKAALNAHYMEQDIDFDKEVYACN